MLETDRAEPERPDFAIEVVWSSGGIDELEVYRILGVKEVWFWKAGKDGHCCGRSVA